MSVKLDEKNNKVWATSYRYEGARECWQSFLVEKSIERFSEERGDRLQHCQHCEGSSDLFGRDQFRDGGPGDSGNGPMEGVENITEIENPLTGVEGLEENSGSCEAESDKNYCRVLDLECSRHEGNHKHL